MSDTRQKATLHSNSQSKRWQTTLSFFYIGLFGLILPFVCWGKYGDPTHPHAHAHFVFQPFAQTSSPPALQPTQPEPVSRLQRDQHTPDHIHNPQPADTTGVSSPSLSFSASVITTLMQIFLLGWVFGIHAPIMRIPYCCKVHFENYIHLIPTPPPRLSTA